VTFPDCPTCGFRLWNPIVELEFTYVALYDDGRFPGRCIVSLQDHMEHLHLMSGPLVQRFMEEVQMVGQAIMKVTDAPRINYAILGNAVPHIHAHVFPRQLPDDPKPNGSPWSAGKAYPLKPESKADIIARLQGALS